ncbi:MAG: hypothetical protein U9Q20_07085, partial [Campylobacterota bacterium]|nr:hypothetical protein [Campylobacterota bacterium]
YVTADGEGEIEDASEYMLTLSNKVTKKLKLFAKYNGWETTNVDSDKNVDRTRVTLGAKYSF